MHFTCLQLLMQSGRLWPDFLQFEQMTVLVLAEAAEEDNNAAEEEGAAAEEEDELEVGGAGSANLTVLSPRLLLFTLLLPLLCDASVE